MQYIWYLQYAHRDPIAAYSHVVCGKHSNGIYMIVIRELCGMEAMGEGAQALARDTPG